MDNAGFGKVGFYYQLHQDGYMVVGLPWLSYLGLT
jgi:hypothetical protein